MDFDQNEPLKQPLDSQYSQYLTFSLSEEMYGIDIRLVTEIIGLLPITQLPRVPDFILGIANLRGKIIPLLDVRLKFGKTQIPYNSRTCVIVVEIQGITAGLVVDSVAEVTNIDTQWIISPPEYSHEDQNRYITGIAASGDDIKLLLDCDRLLNDIEKSVEHQI